MGKAFFFIVLPAAVAGALLFGLAASGAGPTSADCLTHSALEAASPLGLLLRPLPDESGGTGLYFPANAISALAASLGPAGSLPVLLAVLLLDAACVLLVYTVLSRILGRRAAAGAAVFFSLHPLHAALTASSFAGIRAAVTVLLILFCLEGFVSFRKRGRIGGAVSSLVPLFLLGLSSDCITLPLLFPIAALSLGRGDRLPPGRTRKDRGFYVLSWLVFGAAFAVRSALLGRFPLRPVWPPSPVPLGAAALPLPENLPAFAASWTPPVLAAAALGLFLWRLGKERGRFARPALQALLFLAAALLAPALFFRDGPAFLPEIAPALLFLAAAAGTLLAGSGPLSEEEEARAGFRLGIRSSLIPSGVAAFLLAAAALAPCLEIREIGAEAAAIRGDLLAAADRAMEAGRVRAVFIFNEPLEIHVGPLKAMEFLRHDLSFPPVPRNKATGPSLLLLDGLEAREETLSACLHLKKKGLCCRASLSSGLSPLEPTKAGIDAALASTRPMNLILPPECGCVTLERNGFAVSLVPPPETARIRVVLLSPAGPFIVDDFATRMRYPTGRETVFFDSPRLRAFLPLFSGATLALWVEIEGRDGRMVHRTPLVFFRLVAAEDSPAGIERGMN